MTIAYGEQWAPDSLEQAQAWIDTSRPDEGFWEEGVRLADEIMRSAPEKTKTAVEYGCGVGRIIGNIDATNRIGVDASARMLAYAADKFPTVDFVQCDGRSYPIDDNSVDFAYSILVLQHMDAPDAAAVVKDTRRILRPKGVCWLMFSAFGQPWTHDAEVPRGVPMHGTLAYTREIVEQLAIDAGLKIDGVFADDTIETHPTLTLVATA